MDSPPPSRLDLASAEVTTQVETERERVTRWRIAQLAAAGYDGESSLLIGIDFSIDLHRALDLLKRGCSVENALRILF
jgi:hypothetical protein